MFHSLAWASPEADAYIEHSHCIAQYEFLEWEDVLDMIKFVLDFLIVGVALLVVPKPDILGWAGRRDVYRHALIFLCPFSRLGAHR